MSDDITIRSVSTTEEYSACVELQRDTWGRSFTDAVPASILRVAQKVGGVTAGAFATDGKLLGFVFGMTGVEDGAIVHWSDMLAVRPEAQNLGLGRKLKEFQRRECARIGARVIYWTYDPLVARNAYLNFNVFGVRVKRYVRDMYGQTGSDLHRGMPTDRLIVAQVVDDAELGARREHTASAARDDDYASSRILGDAEKPDARADARSGGSGKVRIAVPRDIGALQANSPELAAKWRASTRAAFETAFAAGLDVDGFLIDKARDRGYYLLAKHSDK